MIIIKYLSSNGNEIGEHHFNSDTIKEAVSYAELQLKSAFIYTKSNNDTEITKFESKYVAGYKLIVTEKAKVAASPS
ncbi:hypothetical protein [Solibacillus cecembensis]|uniref:hypothetical protein n=1 Tax=Solibacillus cecembensis TaxID=459347 RepID=UPI003D03FC42